MKIFKAMLYLYQEVDTIKGSGYISKAFSENFPEVIMYKAWILLHESFDNLDTLSMLELREEMLKIKLK